MTLRRLAPTAVSVLLGAFVAEAVALGGSASAPGTRRVAETADPATPACRGAPIVSVGEVGELCGRCPAGARAWTLRLIQSGSADDIVDVTLGRGRTHRTDLPPGTSMSWRLRPGAARVREPADPETHVPAVVLPGTTPLHLVLWQGSEPHIFRVALTVSLAAAIGDTSDCALVASRLSAATYFEEGTEPAP